MKRIKVMSAKVLSADNKKKIEEFFDRKNVEEVTFEYILDDSLIAGVSVIDGNTVYDGSISTKLTTIRNSLK